MTYRLVGLPTTACTPLPDDLPPTPLCPRSPPFPWPCLEHAPDSRDLGEGWGQPLCCECVLVALGEEAGDAGAI